MFKIFITNLAKKSYFWDKIFSKREDTRLLKLLGARPCSLKYSPKLERKNAVKDKEIYANIN